MKNAYSNTDNILLKPKKERNSKGNKNMQKKKKEKEKLEYFVVYKSILVEKLLEAERSLELEK